MSAALKHEFIHEDPDEYRREGMLAQADSYSAGLADMVASVQRTGAVHLAEARARVMAAEASGDPAQIQAAHALYDRLTAALKDFGLDA